MAASGAEALRGRLFFAARVALTFLALGLIFRIAWRGRAAFSAASAWDPLCIAGAAALAPLILGVRVCKWRLLLRPLDARVGFADAFRSYVGCLPWGLVTPGRVGEYSRGWYLPYPAARAGAAGRVLLDNWTDMLGAALWCALGGAALAGTLGALLGAAVCLALAPVPFWMRTFATGVKRLPGLGGLRDLIAKAVPDASGLRGGRMAVGAGFAFAAWGLEWAQMDLLLRGAGAAPGPYWKVAGLMSLAALANSVQVTLAGLGVKEGVAALLLLRAGVSAAVTVPAGLIQTGLNLLLPALIGLLIPRAGGDSRP